MTTLTQKRPFGPQTGDSPVIGEPAAGERVIPGRTQQRL